MNPQREADTVWVNGAPFNRIDIEQGVFQHENMQYLTGEYEAFLYTGQDEQETIMRVGLECMDPDHCDTRHVGRVVPWFFPEGTPVAVRCARGWNI